MFKHGVMRIALAGCFVGVCGLFSANTARANYHTGCVGSYGFHQYSYRPVSIGYYRYRPSYFATPSFSNYRPGYSYYGPSYSYYRPSYSYYRPSYSFYRSSFSYHHPSSLYYRSYRPVSYLNQPRYNGFYGRPTSVYSYSYRPQYSYAVGFGTPYSLGYRGLSRYSRPYGYGISYVW